MTSGKGKCGETDCGHEFPLTAKHCPHCGRPALFPNVRLAEDTEERQALVKRYDDAIEDAQKRGAIDNVQAFKTFVERCEIVRSIPCPELVRLVRSDQELASTFYSLGSTNLDKGSHVLQGKAWDAIRTTAETALFGDDNKKQIHFAALSPSNAGLSSYGDCSVSFRLELTRHRTSAFEENMLVFFKNRGQDYFRTEALPRGYRSTWDDRGRLAVAKLAEKIDATTRPEDFPAILLTNGATSAEDNFIELHLFGDWTVRTISAVVFNNPNPAGMNRTQLRALKHDLTQANVTCQ